MKKRKKEVSTKTLKRLLWIFAVIWYVLIAVGTTILTSFIKIKVYQALLILLIGLVVSGMLSFLTVALIAIVLRWEI